ncbi:hypothetical protein [Acrocarpospora pleiomorpha]|uniref:hypothetical protein n=1 Tax=Acrocarpospora pleiomorpha TaxID=90975 RepID=UPI0012D2C893|nr:hypothetical protein [Acrocarpospora pleiomorpha]
MDRQTPRYPGGIPDATSTCPAMSGVARYVAHLRTRWSMAKTGPPCSSISHAPEKISVPRVPA